MIAKIYKSYANGNLAVQIIAGFVLGVLLGAFYAEGAAKTHFLGELFIDALHAVAPLLVFVLVLTNVCVRNLHKHLTQFHKIFALYIVGMFIAALTAVLATTTFHVDLVLDVAQATISHPESLGDIVSDLMKKIVANPFAALAEGNYFGILMWGIALGLALKGCNYPTQEVLLDLNTASLKIVRFIIKLAPFGVFALVADAVAEIGIIGILSYAHLLILLIGTMLFVFFVVNPFLIFLVTLKNPFPLLWICIKHSAVFAFFTRSSFANIPVNLSLCEKLGIEKDLYSVSIPMGAVFNMAGSAITIVIMSLAAAYTMGIDVTFENCFFLIVFAVFSSLCEAGIPGGTLLLLPLSCSVFQIGTDIAAQVVAIGLVIAVIYEGLETVLNSSTDVLFTAACSKRKLNFNIE